MAKSREAKLELLGNRELQCLGIADGYPDSIDGIAGLDTGNGEEKFPAAKKLADQLLTLPLHIFVSDVDQSRIAALIRKFG